jgi:F-type H+-transporting ATPase subunit gamma
VATVRDLRDRIRSMKNTQQITKAMKQVAAAKIRRAELLQKQTRPYADAIARMLQDLLAAVGAIDHPFMKPGTEHAPVGVILMTADKGLAGSFNANLIRVAEQMAAADRNLVFYPVGNKARNAVRRLGFEADKQWMLQSPDKLQAAREVAAAASEAFVSGRLSKVLLVSPKLINMMSQRPETRQLLPVQAEGRHEAHHYGTGPRGAVEFEPSPEAVLSRLLPKYLEFTLFAAMLETDASFYAAQLVAMNNASDNAKKLIDQLTVQMNNARQASITKEILEIVGGAEALAG